MVSAGGSTIFNGFSIDFHGFSCLFWDFNVFSMTFNFVLKAFPSASHLFSVAFQAGAGLRKPLSHESRLKGEVPFPKSFKERLTLKEDAKRFTRQLPAPWRLWEN